MTHLEAVGASVKILCRQYSDISLSTLPFTGREEFC